MKHRQRRRFGMTLAELLVVITIITISATLILPVVISLARTRRVDGAVSSIQAKLHGAQVRAVAQRATHGLVLYLVPQEDADAPQARFACLIVDDKGDTAAREAPELFPAGLDLLVYHAGDSTPKTMPQVIRFKSDGTVDPALPTPVQIRVLDAIDHTDTTDVIIRRPGTIEVLERAK